MDIARSRYKKQSPSSCILFVCLLYGYTPVEKQINMIENADIDDIPYKIHIELTNVVNSCRPCQLK